MKKKFSVIVVGAGPAGSTAALFLARQGVDVLLLERGKFPGAKNMFGGLLYYTPVFSEIASNFWEQAPVERRTVKKTLVFLTEKAATSIVYESSDLEQPPYNSYTVYRPVFDRWYADQAVAAGAKLVCECTVDDLLWDGKRVRGVKIGREGGEVESDVVIAADGALSRLARKAGLQREITSEDMGLGVKLLLRLPKETIDERFGLTRNQGISYAIIGGLEGRRGGSFLYTNDSSISIGIVTHLGSLASGTTAPYNLVAGYLEHPFIKGLVKGYTSLEYSAHPIPEGGYDMVPKLYTDGMLLTGDAAALCYNSGLNLEGMNLAISSGYFAAQTIIEAKSTGDYSSNSLSKYKAKLEKSHALQDLKTFRHAPEFMKLDDLYTVYPELVCGIFGKVYQTNGQPRKKLGKILWQTVNEKTKLRKLPGQLIKMGRALL